MTPEIVIVLYIMYYYRRYFFVFEVSDFNFLSNGEDVDSDNTE